MKEDGGDLAGLADGAVNLRIADSQKLANANYSNPPAALAGCGQARAAAKRDK